jgi:RNA polymerase sigma factor (TIGR02999 family)
MSDQHLVPRERHPRRDSRPQNCDYRPLVEAAGITASAVLAACAAIVPVAKEDAADPLTVTLWLGLILPARILVFSFIPFSFAFCPSVLNSAKSPANLSSALKMFSGFEEAPLSGLIFNDFQLTSETTVTTLSSQSGSPPKGSFVGHESAGEITRLLQGWRGGDRKALDALLPVVYKELQRLAHFQLRKERPDHTLQSAALVNEAYLRLVGLNAPQWEGRSHFFAIAAQQMRQILVDYARRHRAGKRGGPAETLSLDDTGLLVPGKGRDLDVVALDDALKALAQVDARKAQVVELRFFGGLSFDETAEVLKVSAITVARDWSTARAWLHREMSRGNSDGR